MARLTRTDLDDAIIHHSEAAFYHLGQIKKYQRALYLLVHGKRQKKSTGCPHATRIRTKKGLHCGDCGVDLPKLSLKKPK